MIAKWSPFWGAITGESWEARAAKEFHTWSINPESRLLTQRILECCQMWPIPFYRSGSGYEPITQPWQFVNRFNRYNINKLELVPQGLKSKSVSHMKSNNNYPFLSLQWLPANLPPGCVWTREPGWRRLWCHVSWHKGSCGEGSVEGRPSGSSCLWAHAAWATVWGEWGWWATATIGTVMQDNREDSRRRDGVGGGVCLGGGGRGGEGIILVSCIVIWTFNTTMTHFVPVWSVVI